MIFVRFISLYPRNILAVDNKNTDYSVHFCQKITAVSVQSVREKKKPVLQLTEITHLHLCVVRIILFPTKDLLVL